MITTRGVGTDERYTDGENEGDKLVRKQGVDRSDYNRIIRWDPKFNCLLQHVLEEGWKGGGENEGEKNGTFQT